MEVANQAIEYVYTYASYIFVLHAHTLMLTYSCAFICIQVKMNLMKGYLLALKDSDLEEDLKNKIALLIALQHRVEANDDGIPTEMYAELSVH